MKMKKNLGIYVHIPFCSEKCAYCDFCSVAGRERLIPQYQSAVLSHIKELAPQLDGYYADTVYFGGGTPSFYGAKNIVKIFDALKKYGHVLVDSEVTVEVNPESITPAGLSQLRRAGVNRLSVGVQSANDAMLKSLGRRHKFADAARAVKDARDAGFENISIDLIYGLPSQGKDDWADTLNRAASLKPDHISCYGLKIETGTPLYIFKDSPFIPDDDTQADMYLYAVETLSRFGYRQYEISNFARRGFESRHNLKYWRAEEYIGLGAAAHSYIGGLRYSHISDVEKYCQNVRTGRSVIQQTDEITKFEQASEYLMLGLRTVYGISEEEYRAIYPCSMELATELLRSYESNGWAAYSEGRWRLTPQGFLLSNTLIGEILNTQTRQRAIISKPWIQSEYEEENQITMFDKKQKDTPLFQGI